MEGQSCTFSSLGRAHLWHKAPLSLAHSVSVPFQAQPPGKEPLEEGEPEEVGKAARDGGREGGREQRREARRETDSSVSLICTGESYTQT